MERPPGKWGSHDSRWDYLVAATEKPNPSWLNQKGNLLTQKLKRECSLRHKFIPGSSVSVTPAYIFNLHFFVLPSTMLSLAYSVMGTRKVPANPFISLCLRSQVVSDSLFPRRHSENVMASPWL